MGFYSFSIQKKINSYPLAEHVKQILIQMITLGIVVVVSGKSI